MTGNSCIENVEFDRQLNEPKRPRPSLRARLYAGKTPGTGSSLSKRHYFQLSKGVGGLRSGELAGNRTQDPRIKSALLYQLSYELLTRPFQVQR